MRSWVLENVEDVARRNPRSFFIPSLEERCAQAVGDEVRLHFLLTQPAADQPRAERMWVEITDKRGSPPEFDGILTNQPAFLPDLALGDPVSFRPENIARTIIKRSDPRWFEAAEKKALVSKMAFDPGAAITWMYRETPDREDDSGWRLFAGAETDQYLDDPANVRICNVAWLLDYDPTLDPAIRAEVGSAFERHSSTEQWCAVPDWRAPAG